MPCVSLLEEELQSLIHWRIRQHLCSLAWIRDTESKSLICFTNTKLTQGYALAFACWLFLSVHIGSYESALVDFIFSLFWIRHVAKQGMQCETNTSISIICTGKSLHFTYSTFGKPLQYRHNSQVELIDVSFSGQQWDITEWELIVEILIMTFWCPDNDIFLFQEYLNVVLSIIEVFRTGK